MIKHAVYLTTHTDIMIRDLGSGGAVQKLLDHTVAATEGADVET